ncbi:MAG TPA: DUF1232 domain-containing protein [Aggregatilineales bacterium]|mgnify:FL=1|nr:DUF1232 domain-containing protein [Aggregatilineales bacterium]
MTDLATTPEERQILNQFRLRNPLTERFNFVQSMVRRVRLALRLMRDPRVSLWAKAIPVGIVLYMVSPLDIIPALVTGIFGVVDDLVLLTFGLDLFFRQVPEPILLEHARAMGFGGEG